MREDMQKENIELMINSDLLRIAKMYNIDLDEVLEKAIEEALPLKRDEVPYEKENDIEE